MSGHSKWSTIKHKKGKLDAQRGAAFAKYSREIMIATKLGGSDLAANFRLRTAVEKAKSGGLPNDNIKRAIDKASGAGGSENYEEITYEGYAAGGVAVFIEATTDNRNRTAGDVRSYFTKNNGNLGETGCVGWMFHPKGQIIFDRDDLDQETLFEAAINAGAEDFIEEDDEYKVLTAVEDFQSVTETLEKEGYAHKTAELTRIPQNSIEVTDVQTVKYILRLLDSLESHDDVQNVYANFDICDELMESVM